MRRESRRRKVHQRKRTPFTVRCERSQRDRLRRIATFVFENPEKAEAFDYLMSGFPAQRGAYVDMIRRVDRIEEVLTRAGFPLGHIVAPSRPPTWQSVYHRAKELVIFGLADEKILTRARIERQLILETGCSRNMAQSAASKAVKALDPNNPARRTHKKPIARRMSAGVAAEMIALYESGVTIRRIAEIFGADPKTVSIHLERRKRAPSKPARPTSV